LSLCPLLSNYPDTPFLGSEITLRPYEAMFWLQQDN
jgi:trehalose-6-phosphate hydrolase